MRRVVYQTSFAKVETPYYEDARVFGFDKIKLIPIPEKMGMPANRKKAVENLKRKIRFS